MQFINRQEIISRLNMLTSKSIPYLFIVDFDGREGCVIELSKLGDSDITCCVRGKNYGRKLSENNNNLDCDFQIKPLQYPVYSVAFDKVQKAIKHGDSYLLNLTFATAVGKNLDLEHIYSKSSAPYKLLCKDSFVFYSPEIFIQISGDKIYTFPMKGTISTSVPNAQQTLLDDTKELFEHYTIVDLLRNDLSIIAKDIEVEKFRYIDKIHTSKDTILQTSSKISGTMPQDWKTKFGDLLFELLPAGSITGAPKQKTLEIIRNAEISPRGFYTGVMGIFDGQNIDSCVIIRYLEQQADLQFYYRSGGGITSKSDCRSEYEELIEKIYVPIY